MSKNCYRETFTKIYDEQADKYFPAYPLIWTPSQEIESFWTKHYDVVVLQYLEQYELIGLIDLAIYDFVQTFAKYERAIILTDFAKKYHISKVTLIASIDRLQNAELLDRVCRVDHRGHPIDLVLRPPKAPSELVKGYADILRENVRIQKVQNLRKELGKKFPGNDALFSEKEISRAVGNRHAKDFHEYCVKETYRFYSKNPQGKLSEFKDDLLRKVAYFCQRREINYGQEVNIAALSVCKHYGRKPFDLNGH